MKLIATPSLRAALDIVEDGEEIHVNDQSQVHRDDGPAIVRADGRKDWFVNGLRHRLDGPAIDYGHGRKEWFIDGTLVSTCKHQGGYGPGCWEHYFKYKADMWKLLKANPEQIVDFANVNEEMKDYALQLRPDLISKIPNLGKKLKAKYWHELELAGVDL